MFNKMLFAVIVTCMATVASAKVIMLNGQPVNITSIDANGAGCSSDTVVVTSTPDNTQAAILFSTYKAMTDTNNTVAVSDCNIAVGLAVGAGFSVGIVDIDWRGSVFTSPGAFVNFHREYFFSGHQGPVTDTYWNGGGFENFFLEDTPIFVNYSSCDGKPLIARFDTSATVIGGNSFFSLRSADVKSELLLTLKVRPCS